VKKKVKPLDIETPNMSESHNPMVKAMMKVASKMFGVFLPFFQEIKKQFPEKKPKKKW
jgi:hypothetical protein